MCLDNVGGGNNIQEVTLNLLRSLKRYFSRITGTPSSCSSSIMFLNSCLSSWIHGLPCLRSNLSYMRGGYC